MVSKTRLRPAGRGGYETLDKFPDADERKHTRTLSDATNSSNDDPIEDDDNVELLPLNTSEYHESTQNKNNASFATPSSSFSSPRIDDGDEPHDVGERIEQLLEAERNPLSKTFDVDLEDIGSMLSMSDIEDEDYAFMGDKSKQENPGTNGKRNLKAGIESIYTMKSWWHTFALVFVGILLMCLAAQESVPWYPAPYGGVSALWKESYAKAHDLVQRMDLLEKVNITTGTGWMMGMCVGNTGKFNQISCENNFTYCCVVQGPAESVGFPSLCLQDGPLGLRFAENITAFPAGVTTGATWNRELMRARGLALGQESRSKGVNVILGPSMGPLGMMPAGGRNWEAFGADPVLQGVAAAETIRGIQRTGVMATAKHFLMNEQEHYRQPFEWGIPNALSSNIDDRALHEVFAWPFAESVRADVASVMCSYQRVNNSHACENSKLINGILKDELGFQGFVQSDWLAQRSGVQSALSGLDMSMPGDGLHWADGDSLWGSQLTRAVLNSSVPIDRLNDMVTRIVAAWYHFRQDSWKRPPPVDDGGPNFSSWTKERIGGLHPGSPDDHTQEVVNRFVNAQGSGSQSHANLTRSIAAEGTVLLKNVNNTLPLSRLVSIPDRKYRIGIYGEDAGPGQGPNFCADRGCNQGTLASGWGSGAVNFPYLVNPWDILQFAWSPETVDVRGYLTNNVTVQDLTEQDLCLVFANADSGEGFINSEGIYGDRNDLFLQHNGTQLIEDVAKNCGGGQGKTVVVLHSVGPVIVESWIDLPSVYAVLYANLPGEESGNALADVLFGEIDASGRLPYTIGRKLEDYGPGAQILYESSDPVPQVTFADGLYIDYRYFDKYNITPRFEFGFGLSYTRFDLSKLRIHRLQEKSRFPSKRPKNEVEPPKYTNEPLNPSSFLFPSDFTALSKYVYPYLSSREGTEVSKYPYPEGYKDKQTPSAAGGGPGGNPSLYEPMLELSVSITNTGTRPGKEVVQIYVSFPEEVAEHHGLGWTPEKIEFPDRVLRNFTKVALQSGESTTVNMTLSRKDLSYWSVRAQNWILPTEGSFKIWAGRSSRDLPLVAEF
ncbi:hypothetical protein N7495_007757 [Penicillium taxi]|uniref:uncharacterized protein n=1 Tax=Penicillium taxi TaxID=168475 RepID=UPI002544EBAE|nr:uncharacterized protein N7495_007757 [Penicillium taxi]KAJ5887716.1 hypothetical protein N7495_007757 [Penicillium taxi]